jgi:4-amino-4-deoxy-L-arabinose transferase-like glycosyltransferase
MFQRLNCRLGHYGLLLAVGAVLFLPNLGGPSLWDIDEGNNAEAAREMLASGNAIVPTFNFELRVDKPALLYWLQIGAYELFGVNEFAARFPSAMAALLAIFCTYELGRRMFGAIAGLLAGLMLASTVLFCAAAHFANADALLSACTLLAFLFFWNSFARGDRSWFVLCGLSAGLAMLAKGPVGLVLPSAVAVLFLFWARRIGRLIDWRLLSGMLAFGLVVVPWYAWVGAETRGNYLKGFFIVHNIDRYTIAMEGHAGNLSYYFFVLVVGFAPWSAFLGLSLWYSLKFHRVARGASKLAQSPERERPVVPPVAHAPGSENTSPQREQGNSSTALSARPGERHAVAYLWCWIVVYFAFFSVSRTKLPNYILPMYPAVALLTARFLERWRRGDFQPPAWMLHVGPACLALLGVGTIIVPLMLGGAWSQGFLQGRTYSGLEHLAALGVLPVVGAFVTWRCLRNGRRTGAVTGFAASAVMFLASVAAEGAIALEPYKAPRELVHDLHDNLTSHEVRVGVYQYFQPSLVFYCRREVQKLKNDEDMLEFLNCPLPVYLFLPAAVWERLHPRVTGPCHLLGRRRDLYRNCEVVVVTNR